MNPFETEKLIVEKAQQGEEAALEDILRRYKTMVKRKTRAFYMAGADDDDLVQEGMIGLFKAVRDYNPEKNDSFGAFAGMCVHRQLVSVLKKGLRQKNIPLNSYISLSRPLFEEESGPSIEERLSAQSEPSPESLLLMKEDNELVSRRIERELSPFEKEVLTLYLKGLSYESMAESLSTAPKSIDNALQRIKRKLSRTLKNRL